MLFLIMTASDAENLIFNRGAGGAVSFNELMGELKDFISQEGGMKHKLIIGTDSEYHNSADFVTVLVLYRPGRGGRYFWRRLNIDTESYKILRERIYKEVLLSLEFAQVLLAKLKDYFISDFDLEIHLDVGENGPTRAMLQEIVGMVRGYGFAVKTKPYAFGASNVADRHV